MMARRGVLGVLSGTAVLLLSGCGILGGEKSYRFRMTVEVETSRGVKTGSSVMEVTAFEKLKLTSEERSGGGGLRGEAVVVDLPDGPLFVLLTMRGGGEGLNVAATRALAPDAPLQPVRNYVATVGKLGSWLGGAKAELPRADWPLMVRFRDINDPTSVEKIDPETVGVKRMVVETTGDDVTTGIEDKFPPWFMRLVEKKAMLNGKASAVVLTNNLVDNLGPGSFSTEIR